MTWFIRMNIAALLITFIVVVLGAYVRLSGAGLSCPDWPGCYGNLVVPSDPELKEKLGAEYNLAVEEGKAWKEMIHRYLASLLGLWLIAMAIVAWRIRKAGEWAPLGLAVFLVFLAGLQGALGAFTVTELVSPSIVSMHLMGGMSVLGVLMWQLVYVRLRTNKQVVVATTSQKEVEPNIHTYSGPLPTASTALSALSPAMNALRPLALIGFIILACQIFLGAWTSTNYAAWTVCNDFPTCDGSLWPTMNFSEAFTMWKPLGINYEHAVNHVSVESKRAIQVVHRIGALVTFVYLFTLCITILLKNVSEFRGKALLVLFALSAQVLIGIFTATGWFGDRSVMAVSHNAGAALLLLAMINLLAPLYGRRVANEDQDDLIERIDEKAAIGAVGSENQP